MSELLSLVLTLTPPPEATTRPLPRWWGRATHALLLRVLDQADPDLAAHWHNHPNAPRPFTASTLWGGHVDRGEPVFLRLTAFEGRVAACLQQAAERGPLAPGATVELDGLRFAVQQAAHTPAEHPWAQRTTWQALAGPWLTARIADPPRRLDLELVSPTTFRTAGRHLPLPLPELVFGSLLTRWNAFAPVALPEEVRRYAAECLVLTAYRLRTRSVPLKEGARRIGALGWVTYRTVNYDRYWMSTLHALLDFALFAGLGAGTGMGLGQARRRLPDGDTG